MEKWKKKLLAIAITAALLTLVTQPALAYYTVIGRATNVVTSGEIKLRIHEKTAEGADFPAEGVYIIPGETVSKVVSIENICTHPFYLRVALSNGSSHTSLDPRECFRVNINRRFWTEREDGYYYYNRVLKPGETTEYIFSEVEIVGKAVDQSHIGSALTLTVDAYAVQSENNPAEQPWDASGWPEL